LFINNTSSSIGFGGPIGFGGFTANDNRGPEPAVDIMNVFDPGSVSFISLNILDAFGTLGLDVTDTASLSVETGTIDVANEQAINIADTPIDVTFESVSSSNSPTNGIFVLDSPGSFTITGDGVNNSSGGIISGAADAGALFDNTDEVSITLQDYVSNNIGVQAQNMNDDEDDFLFLDAMQFTNNANQSVLTNDVRNITIEDSIFTNISGGATGLDDHYIDLRVLDNPNNALEAANLIDDTLDITDPDFVTHVYIIQRNEFIDINPVAFDDAVLIRTFAAAAADSSLELAFDDNLFSSFNRAGTLLVNASALEVNWNGFLTAAVRGNIVNMGSGNGQTGFNIITQGSDTFVDVNVANNVINGGNGVDAEDLTGMNFTLTGPSSIRVDSNRIDLRTVADITAGSTNVGMRFQFIDGANSVALVNNLVLMDEGTAVRVQTIPSPLGARSSFFFEANQLGAGTRFPDQGLIFSSVTGLMNIGGTNNLVFVQFEPGTTIIDPNDVFSVDPTNVTGSIEINNEFLP